MIILVTAGPDCDAACDGVGVDGEFSVQNKKCKLLQHPAVRRAEIEETRCDVMSIFQVITVLVVVTGNPQQAWDVERLIRARNPGAVFTTTERADVTWQTLRSITYSPTLHQGAVGSASVQEASLVRR